MSSTIQDLIRNLSETGLLSNDKVDAIREAVSSDRKVNSPDEFARYLVKQKHLTKLQAAAVLKGKSSNLVFGDYVVLDKIGKGGMGQVFLAEHRPTAKHVALKVLSAEAVKNRRLIERFKKEARAVSRLKHPNIVRAYEAGKINRIRYLVMEFVDGENMLERVKRKGPLSVDECVSCVLQAARGLAYAHDKGIIHRDIKPSNLLRDRHDARVKVLDMGLARVEEAEDDEDAMRLTMPGQMLGTARFMSPEQVEDARKADIRSDVYSLGCTLYFLLRAKAPYSGETVAHTLMAHVSAPIPNLCKKRKDVPEWLGEVFAKMLEKKPRDRFQTMGELVVKIQQHLGEDLSRRDDAHVLLDEEPADDDEFSKIIGVRDDEGSSLDELYSESEDRPSEEFEPAEPDIPDNADELLAGDVAPEADEGDVSERPRGFTERSRSSAEQDVDLAAFDETEHVDDDGIPTGESSRSEPIDEEKPSDISSVQEFRLGDSQMPDPDEVAAAGENLSQSGVGEYVMDKLKNRRDQQVASNRRVQLLAFVLVGATVLGLLGWLFMQK